MWLFRILVLVLALNLSGVWGTSVRPLNLVEMVKLADRVFLGRCLSVNTGAEGPRGLPVVEYVFRVERAIKGVGPAQDVIVRQAQNGGGGQPGLIGIPQYEKGARRLLFLHGDSPVGLTSPVGLGQGVFHVVGVKGAEKGINALRNANLAHRLGSQPVQHQTLTVEELGSIQGTDPIPIETFARLVAKIDREQKGESLR